MVLSSWVLQNQMVGCGLPAPALGPCCPVRKQCKPQMQVIYSINIFLVATIKSEKKQGNLILIIHFNTIHAKYYYFNL